MAIKKVPFEILIYISVRSQLQASAENTQLCQLARWQTAQYEETKIDSVQIQRRKKHAVALVDLYKSGGRL